MGPQKMWKTPSFGAGEDGEDGEDESSLQHWSCPTEFSRLTIDFGRVKNKLLLC